MSFSLPPIVFVGGGNKQQCAVVFAFFAELPLFNRPQRKTFQVVAFEARQRQNRNLNSFRIAEVR